MIVFNCPTCEKRFKLSDRFAGRTLFCSGCKTDITVPQPKEELGWIPMPDLSSLPTYEEEDLYKIPEAEALDVRFDDGNIEFDCSNCGKHYAFTRRFAGRIMLCTECKSELCVPEPGEELALAKPYGITDEKPEIAELPKIYPVPPPVPEPPSSLPLPPPPGGFTSSSGFNGSDLVPPDFEDDTHRFENAVSRHTEDDSAILAYVYQEKHGLEKHALDNHGETTSTIPPPAPKSMASSATLESLETVSRKPWHLVFWLGIIGILVLCIYLVLTLETISPDRRPELLEQIVQRKKQAGTESGVKEAEARLLSSQSLDAWNNVGALIDNYLVTFGEYQLGQKSLKSTASAPRQQEIRTAIQAVENRLGIFAQQVHDAFAKARDLESSATRAGRDSKLLQAEGQFFAEEESKLAEWIRSAPRDRTIPKFPDFAPEPVIATWDETIPVDRDWTENDLSCFDVTGPPSSDGFFVTFEAARRHLGNKSLRITSREKEPITLIFPGQGRLRSPSGNAISFIFSIRFPEVDNRITLGVEPESGKIGELRIRFVNSSGYVDFTTVSPRYCEALYYDSRSHFTTVEFPLSGDEFWKRTDHFDLTKLDRRDDKIDAILSGETVDAENETAEETQVENTDSFFTRFDRVEIRFTPLSFPTTFWLDGITVSAREISHVYDLARAESLQSDLRDKDAALLRKRLAALTETSEKDEEKKTDISGSDMPEVNPLAEDSPPEFAGSEEQRIRKTFLWILREGNGRIQARVDGQQRSFGSKSPEPDSFENFVVEEVDLSRSRNVTIDKLDLLSVLKDLKKLDLSHTGLVDESLIRIATLTQLESLNLGGNGLTFACIPNIQTLRKLRELNLDGIRTSVDGIDALGDLTGLRSLSLARSLTDSGDLIYLLTLTELEHLDLSGTKIGDRVFGNLRAFPTLQSLNLSKTRITDAGIAQLDRLPKLRRLELNETGLTDACLKSIGKFEALEEISVLKTKITREGVRQSLGSAWVSRFKFSE